MPEPSYAKYLGGGGAAVADPEEEPRTPSYAKYLEADQGDDPIQRMKRRAAEKLDLVHKAATPGATAEYPIDDQAPSLGFFSRILIENTRGDDPKLMYDALKNEGFDVVNTKNGWTGSSFSLKDPSDGKWYVLDPSRFEPIADALDVVGLTLKTGIGASGRVIGGALGLFGGGAAGTAAAPGPGTAVGAGVGAFIGQQALGTAAEGATDAALMGLGNLFGMPVDVAEQGKALGKNVAASAVSNFVLAPALGKAIGWGGRQIGKLREALPGIQRGVAESRTRTLGEVINAVDNFTDQQAAEIAAREFQITTPISRLELAKKVYEKQEWAKWLDKYNSQIASDFFDAQSPGRFTRAAPGEPATYNPGYDVSKAADFDVTHVTGKGMAQWPVRYGQPELRTAEDFLKLPEQEFEELARRIGEKPGVPQGISRETIADRLAELQRGATQEIEEVPITRAKDEATGFRRVVRNDLPEFETRPSGQPYQGGWDSVKLDRIIRAKSGQPDVADLDFSTASASGMKRRAKTGFEAALDESTPGPLSSGLRGIPGKAKAMAGSGITKFMRSAGRGAQTVGKAAQLPWDIGIWALQKGLQSAAKDVGEEAIDLASTQALRASLPIGGGARVYGNFARSSPALAAAATIFGGRLHPSIPYVGGAKLLGLGLQKAGQWAERGGIADAWKATAKKLVEKIYLDEGSSIHLKRLAGWLDKALEQGTPARARSAFFLLMSNPEFRSRVGDMESPEG